MPLAPSGFETSDYFALRRVTGPLKVRTDTFAPPPLESMVSSAPRPNRPGIGVFLERLLVMPMLKYPAYLKLKRGLKAHLLFYPRF